MFQMLERAANFKKSGELRSASDKKNFRFGVIEDIGYPLGRFVEIDGNGDAARAGDGEVRSVPFGTVCGEEGDAIARLNAEFKESLRQTGNAAKKFLRRDLLPTGAGAKHLRTRIGPRVDGMQEV